MSKLNDAPTPARSSGPTRSSEEVTVLVFKDNESARTFQVPLDWISRLGFFLLLLLSAALLSSFFAVKFYRLVRKTDPTHVVGLEQEIEQLKTANQALQAKVNAPVSAVPVATPSTAVVATPSAAAPVVPVAVEPPPTAVATSVQASVDGIPLFTALPRKFKDLSTQASGLPFVVSPAKLHWSGKNLKVNFALQYTATDGGSQQGRIVILARGPDTVLGYPEEIFNRSGAESLVATAQGEYFSVSRFREVKAEFGPVRNTGQILDVEIMILSLDDQLLFFQKLVVPQSKPVTPPAKPAAPKAAAPVAAPATPAASAAPVAPATKSDSEIIEPGVDQ